MRLGSLAAALAGVAFSAATALAQQPIKPAVVYDKGGKFDKSFNEGVFIGADKFKKETGVEFRDFEPTNDAQIEQALRRFARDGNSPIIAVGFSQATALQKVAADLGVTVAQAAIGWVSARGDDILPLVGARTRERLAESLQQIYAALDADQRLILEYKFFEPYFYTTDIPDWGTSLLHCLALGPQAMVVLDTGHHAPGTNIEFIVAQLLRVGRLGAFDFNSRFYADDDLMVGAADPFQLFRIMNEIVRADALRAESGVNFMLDQCHNIESKILGQIRSVMNVQEATAKALLVDRDALGAAQAGGDVLGANAILMDAYNTDVRPLLAEVRQAKGLDPDPVAAFKAAGYEARVAAERVGGTQAGWGA